MADAYKGLTIRIGANTDDLTKALRSSNQIITQTSTRLNQLSRALKFDPESASGLSTQMSLMSEKGQALYAKFAKLNEVLRTVNSSDFKNMEAGMSGLSKETQEAITRVKYATEQYARVCDEIAKQKNLIQELAGVDERFWDKSHGDMQRSFNDFVKHGKLTQDVASHYYELQRAYNKWDSELSKAKGASALQQVEVDAIRVKAELNKLSSEYMELSAKQARAFMGSDVEKYRGQLERLDATTEELKGDFETLDHALNLNPENANVATMMLRNLGEQADLSEQKVETLKKTLAEMQQASGLTYVAHEMRNIATETIAARDRAEEANLKYMESKGLLEAVHNEVETLKAKLGGASKEVKELVEKEKRLTQETSELKTKAEAAMNEFKDKTALNEQRKLTEQLAKEEAQAKSLRDQANGVNNAWKTAFSSMTSVGMTAYATITPVAQAFFDKAITAAQDLDGAYRDMRKTVEATEEQYEALRTAAIEFSNTHVTTADQVLEIEAMGGQLGIAAENLEQFATTIANLDIATNIDADTVAEQMGQLSSIMDIAAEDFDNFGDALVRLGNNEPALESAIMDITSRIGSQATLLGMSADQVLAYSTALAATGQNAEAAGTALSKTMAQIEAAAAHGAEGVEGFAEVAGMSAQEFADAWENDASGALQKFIEGLKQIHESGGSVEATLQGLKITAVRQKQALNGLTQTTDVLTDSLTMSKNAWNGVSDQWGAAGDAAREAAAKSQGFSGALGILENVTGNLAAEIAEGLTPFLFAAGDALQSLYGIVKEFPDGLKVLIVALAGIGIAAGPVLTAIGSIGAFLEQAGMLSGTAAGAMRDASKSIKKGFDKVADGASGLAESSGKATDALAKTEQQTGKTSKKLGGLKTAAKVAAAAVAVLAVAALADYVTQCINTKKATQDLRSTLLNASNAMTGQAPAAQTAKKSLFDYMETSKQLKTSQAQLADQIAQSFSEVGARIGILDQAKATIQKYGDATNLTSAQVADLKQAVELVNKELGTNYQVVASGNAYKVIGDDAKNAKAEILNLIEAQELQMRTNAYMEAYTDSYKQYMDDLAHYNELTNEKIRLQNEKAWYVDNNKNGEYTDQISSLTTQIALLDTQISDAKRTMDAANDAATMGANGYKILAMAAEESASEIVKTIAANDQALTAMNGCAGGAANLVTMFEEAGVKADDLNKIDWNVLATNFDGTYSSIAGNLKEWGVGIDEAKAKAMDMQSGFAIAFASVKDNSELATSQTIKNLEEQGVSIDQLIKKFQDAGISLEDLGKLSDSELSSLVGMYSKSTDDIKAAFSDMASSVEAEGQSVAECVGQGWQAGLDAYTGKGVEWAQIESESLLNEIRSALGIHSPSTVMEEIGQFTTDGFINGLKANNGEIVGAFNEAITQMVSEAVTHDAEFNQLGFQFMSVMASSIQANQYLVTDALSGVFVQCAAGVASSGIQDSFYQVGNSALSSFAAGIESGSGSAENAARAAGSRIAESVKANQNDYTNAGRQAMLNFAHGIDGASGNPISAGKYAAQRAAKQTVDVAFSGFHNTGYWAMKGFAAGMNDNRWIANQAAAAAAKDAKKAADDAIGVSSPAKAFIDTGFWAMKGLAVGIEDNAKFAIKATEDSMDDVVKQAQAIIDRASLSIETTVAGDLSGDHVVSVAFDEASKIASSEKVTNIYLNDLVVNDDAEIQQSVLGLIKTLKRKGVM